MNRLSTSLGLVMFVVAMVVSGCAGSRDLRVLDPQTVDATIRTEGNAVPIEAGTIELNPSCRRADDGFSDYGLELSWTGDPGFAGTTAITFVASSAPRVVFEGPRTNSPSERSEAQSAEVVVFPADYVTLATLSDGKRTRLLIDSADGRREVDIPQSVIMRIQRFAWQHPPTIHAGREGNIFLPVTLRNDRREDVKTLRDFGGVALALGGLFGYLAVDHDIDDLRRAGEGEESLDSLKARRFGWACVGVSGLLLTASSAIE
ncbi:MAG: hypothetical protein KC729_09485 [Candidatus Eisenbacteria bacterium]|uniref:Uncharacterized protein n=1 Tax=Eiseniibacteriota bacterium TaxID=2212470 RepID=A0A956RNT9_UNCEI|nr:hypothetical protein [Candidatus Eisenbacteria bacterium]